jgi:hypothetical protein
MADITPPKEITNFKNFRPTTRFLRAKREKGGGWAFIISHKEKEKKNDVNIARAVLTKNNRFKKQIKRELSMARARLLTPNVAISAF